MAAKRIAGVFLVDRDAGGAVRVLLLRRCGTGSGDGTWDAPGGHAEEGEPDALAACREVTEEVGVELRPDDLVDLFEAFMPTDDGGRVIVYFAATRWTSDPINREPQFADSCRWWPLDHPPVATRRHVSQALNALVRRFGP